MKEIYLFGETDQFIRNYKHYYSAARKRSICLVKQISLLEIVSTATVLLAMVVESSRAFHVVG